MRPDLHKGVPFALSSGDFHYARLGAVHKGAPGEIKAFQIEWEPHYAERSDFQARGDGGPEAASGPEAAPHCLFRVVSGQHTLDD